MASCSPCRFMFGDNIRISAGMEPMLYPDCERERAVGLRDGRACAAIGSVRRPELCGGLACVAIGSVRRPELCGGQSCVAIGSVGRPEVRGGRACVATGSVGRPELRGLYFAVILYVAAICGF